MSNVINIQHHPSSVDNYIKHGWSLIPIPFGQKGPMTRNWNIAENCLRSQEDLPEGWGIGLAHAYSGTMALDIDEWSHAEKKLGEMGIDLNELYNAQDAVIIDSGRHGHGKLIYQMPFGLVLPSKKLIDVDGLGRKFNYLDFRCATANGLTVQDVLPPSIHPTTYQPYKWAGNGHWSKLPMIPHELLNYWQSLIEEDAVRDIADREFTTSWAEIQEALYTIDPDIDRDQWVMVGMALHYAGYQDRSLDVAFSIWDDWSAQSETKYKGTKDLKRSWNSFKPNNGITIGSLFHLARKHGWTRQMPSVDELFESVEEDEIIPPSVMLRGMAPVYNAVDMSLFPEPLSNMASEVAEQVGCDPIVPLFAGMGAICGAIDARIRLKLMDGFEVPPVLWFMTIGAPADKKTPGSAPMMGTLKNLEKEDHERYKKDYLAYDGQLAGYTEAYKNFIEWSKSPEAMLGSEPPHVPEEPREPVPLQISVSDVTSQKLVRLAADRERGLLCYLDEMNSWFKKMTDNKSGEDRSSWVVAYESNSYTMDRVGSGPIHANNFAVSVYGNVQPDVFRRVLPQIADDGLVQRFIPGMLDTRHTKIGQPGSLTKESRERWDSTVRTVYAIPPMYYDLTLEAFFAYREFQEWYEKTKQEYVMINTNNTFMSAFGKIEGTVGRLALLFHCIEDPFNVHVGKNTVERAIKVVKEFIIPTFRACYSHVRPKDQDDMDRWFAEYILSICCDTPETDMVKLRKATRNKLPSTKISRWQRNEIIKSAMMSLEDAKWVTKIEDDNNEHIRWAINPKLYQLHAGHVEKVNQIRRKYKTKFE